MLFRNWLETMTPRSSSRRSRRAAPEALTNRLTVESLEDRLTPAAMLTIGDAYIVEGTTNAAVQVNLTEPHGNNVTVDFNTVNGSAMSGSDYTAMSGKFTFTKNELSKTILIPIRDDHTFEPTESFTVRLSVAKGAKIADAIANVTITENSPLINVSNYWSASEGNAGTKEFKFTVSLSHAYDEIVTVDFTTADGSATTANRDYVARNGTLTFKPGEPTSQEIAVVVNGDHTSEYEESFQVILSNASRNAQINSGVGYAYITNDEPSISVSGRSASEGNAGTTEFKFTVSLSAAYDETVTVDFATADLSATTADFDYVAKNGTLIFRPNEPTSQDIIILVNGDIAPEFDESFQVNLSNPSSNAQINGGVAYGNITDEEPRISISDVTFYYNTTYITFAVTLANAPEEGFVTVDFTTLDGSAYAGYDYVTNFGTLTFGNGVTTQYIDVDVLNFNSSDIYFYVQLSNASPSALIANDLATAYWYYDYGYYYDPGYYYYDYGYYW